MPAPTITQIFPNVYNQNGSPNDLILMVGTNFEFSPLPTITIGGVAITGFFVSTTSLIRILTLPALPLGVLDVTITTTGGSFTLVGGFTSVSTPTITALNIPYGTTVGGTVIGINGSAFSGLSTVLFGAAPATIVHQDNFPQMGNGVIVLTPPHVAGIVDVTVVAAAGSFTLPACYTYQVPPIPAKQVLVFDDSCHLWLSTDTAGTWVEGITPTGADTPNNVDTLGDPWSDLLMATNDQNYTNVFACDTEYNGTFGAWAFSAQDGLTHTWHCIDPEIGSPAFIDDFDHWTQSVSGAYSANGTMLIASYDWAELTHTDFGDIYPRISRDNGVTWDNVTGVPPNVIWSRACFSANAQIVYLKPRSTGNQTWQVALNPPFILKSTDGGNTFTQLPGGPPGAASDFESEQRLRCSPDGQIIGWFDLTHVLWISIDGGTTWTTHNFVSFFGFPLTNRFVDFGMSDDGQVIIVGMERQISSGFWPAIAVSKDGGTTWTDVSNGLVYPTSAGGALGPFSPFFPSPTGFTSCNVTPAGDAFVVCFEYGDFAYETTDGTGTTEILYSNVSLDQGATWIVCSYLGNQGEPGSFLGLYTASYITPLGTPPPPPAPPNPGGYIIERFDNRLWPTVENAWCVDCGFTLHRPTPAADLNVAPPTGAIVGVGELVGGANYSAGTTATVTDANGLGPGTGAVPILTIAGGAITAIVFSPPGQNYVFPEISFYDPANTGSGASATLILDTSARWLASDPVFSLADIGSIIRAGYSVAEIIQVLDSQTVTVEIRTPVAQLQQDNLQLDGSIVTSPAILRSGTWTMTQPISTLYLPALQGFTITGIADGQVIPPTLVPASGPNAGVVVLPQPASAIIVGLAFEAQLQSVYLDTGEPTAQGQRKKVAAVTARIEASAAFEIGANQPDGAVQSPPQIDPTWQNMTAAPIPAKAPYNSLITPLFTGDVRIPVLGGYNVRGQVAVQQRQPLPLQVLAFVPEALAGDKPAQEAPKKQGGRNG